MTDIAVMSMCLRSLMFNIS